MTRIALILLYLLYAVSVKGIAMSDSTILSIEFPISSPSYRFTQTLSYETNIDTLVDIRIDCYYFTSDVDSVHLYDLTFEKQHLKSGAAYIDLPFSKALSMHKMHADYFDIVRRFKMVPAGKYKTQIEFRASNEKESLLLHRNIEQFVDSNLAPGSGLKERMNAAIALPQSAKQQAQQKSTKKKKQSNQSQAQIKVAEQKMKRALRHIKGLEMRSNTNNGKTYSEAYYKNFFLGRYEMAAIKELNDRAEKETKQLSSNSAALVSNELEGFQSVGSQMKDMQVHASKESRYKGIIDISTYRATAQDPQSAIQQNYTEFLGNLDLEIMGMPFSIEGFYTSQDANRQAKASYFRFHYDVASAKSKLQKTISGYKNKLGETVSKGQGLESVYGNYAKSLESQKKALLHSLAKEYDLDPKLIVDNGGDVHKIVGQLPVDTKDTSKLLELGEHKSSTAATTAQSAEAKKEKLLKNKKDIEDKYKRIEALQTQALKYYNLLEQYRTKNHLDSAINYKKIAGLESGDPSYKDMTKAAAGILPEGKSKQFITGLTNFDAGIINKYESDYTMAGQTMKGLSMGYDIGLLKTGVSVGSTEYVSREGRVDHYTSMLFRIDNKSPKNHKIGLLYNINTPSKAMSTDDNFIGNQGLRYPSFSSPTQIISLVYDGKISKHLIAHSEIASSFKAAQSTKFDMAHAALNNDIEFNIPNTTIALKGAWEHLGNSFENNSLPYIRSGTDRYSVGTGMNLFHSFLSLKVDYNYLIQQTFASTGYNTKWGFDVGTHSRRYPSVNLSYKPFSTFRSFADTLQIAQRPIQGEVWMARSSYQIKRHHKVHRFTFMYNKNSSTADTISYQSSTAQIGYIYSCPGMSINASLSRVEVPNNFADGSGIISSYISTIGMSKAIGKSWNISFSPDLSLCTWGLQRYAGTAGILYRMNNKPLSFRMTLRYSNYKLKAGDEPLELYAGQMGMNWQFKSIKGKKNRVNN